MLHKEVACCHSLSRSIARSLRMSCSSYLAYVRHIDTIITCNKAFGTRENIQVIAWQADGIHSLGQRNIGHELNQGNIIVKPAWSVVRRMTKYPSGSDLLLCTFVDIPIMIANHYLIASGIPALKPKIFHLSSIT